MNKKVLITMIAFLGQGAFAHEGMGHECGPMGPHHEGFILPGVLQEGPGPKEGPCADMKLTKEEKAKIKEAYFKFKESKIDLESNLKRADLNEEKVSADAESDFAAAEAASAAKMEAIGKLMQADHSFRNNVLYNILKPEQRSAARACWRQEHFHGGPKGFKGKHDKKDFKKDKEDKK
jgi:Spy/CpxP family protein refolding chaperone